MEEKCILCGNAVKTSYNGHKEIFMVQCPTCGYYLVTREAREDIDGEVSINKKYLISGLTREAFEEGAPITLTSDELKNMVDEAVAKKPQPLEAIDTILRYFYSKIERADDSVYLDDNLYPIVYAKDFKEFYYFFEKVIELGYIENIGDMNYCLTLKGWERLAQIGPRVKRTNQAFVAMWFDHSIDVVYFKGIEPALSEVGYNPVRVDFIEHNGKICDRIIAEIRKSSLLIADFTGHRGGVYFEAGFALGLGIPVIWTCREDSISEAHFDTRQYNHITWKDPDELRKKLINRIMATVPQKKL